MAQYISIYAKHKDATDDDKSFCLFCRSCSFFYGLGDYLGWTGENPPVELDKNSLSRVIQLYTEEVLKPEEANLEEYSAQLKDLGWAGIHEGEAISDLQFSMKDTRKEIAEIKEIISELQYVVSLMDDCTNRDFIYYYINS